MRIALAQIDTTVGDLRGNSEKILSALDEACRRGASLAVFPEQTLGGYPALDLWEEPGFAAANEKALAALAKKVRGTAALVGFVSRWKGKVGKPVRNSAALLHNGKVIAIRHKTLLPTYDVFDEARYFEPASENKPISWGGLKLGVTICEDAWAKDPSTSRRLYDVDPVAAQAKAGADLLLNLSASPFLRGKTEVRKTLIAEHAKRLKKPLFYCNAVGGNDEIVFDGGSLAYDAKGKLRARGAFSAEDLLVIDTKTWEGATVAPEPSAVGQVGEILTLGIKDFAGKCGLQTAFLGLSGGIDSAVAAALAVRALGPHRVVGVTMPSSYSSQGSLDDARALAKNLGIELRSAPIAGVYDALVATLGDKWGKGTPDLAEQNLQARARGVILMGLANKAHRGFVLTTGNKSELAVGYCTLYGDMCGALAPLADAPKRLVYELAGWLNSDREIIPSNSITKAPSAELKPDQKDQDDLPPYDQVDDALEAWVQSRLEPGRVARAVGDRAVAETLLDRMDWSEFKRRQAPPSIKISSKAFGVGRRMPIAKAGWRVRAGLLVLLALAGPLLGRPAAAAPWVPRDAVAMGEYRGKDFTIVAYQYRIEFFSKREKKPAVVLTFKHPVSVSPSSADWGKDSRGNILACTDRFLVYSIQDPEERRLASGGDGESSQMYWEDPKARYPDFCGILGPDGTVVFQLPREEFPARMYEGLGIAAGGKRAAFLVGAYGKWEEPNEGSETDEGLNVKEIWVWEAPATLRKRRMTEKDRSVFLLGELRAGRL